MFERAFDAHYSSQSFFEGGDVDCMRLGNLVSPPGKPLCSLLRDAELVAVVDELETNPRDQVTSLPLLIGATWWRTCPRDTGRVARGRTRLRPVDRRCKPGHLDGLGSPASASPWGQWGSDGELPRHLRWEERTLMTRFKSDATGARSWSRILVLLLTSIPYVPSNRTRAVSDRPKRGNNHVWISPSRFVLLKLQYLVSSGLVVEGVDDLFGELGQ